MLLHWAVGLPAVPPSDKLPLKSAAAHFACEAGHSPASTENCALLLAGMRKHVARPSAEIRLDSYLLPHTSPHARSVQKGAHTAVL